MLKELLHPIFETSFAKFENIVFSHAYKTQIRRSIKKVKYNVSISRRF